MSQYFNLVVIFLLIGSPAFAQQITLDEDISEWSQVQTQFSDPEGDSDGIDLLSLKITNDDRFLYFLMEVNQEFDLQEDNDLVMYIDTDNNPETGTLKNGIGYEFEFRFGERTGFFNGSSVSPYVVGLIGSPTVTSTTFEFKFDLETTIGESSVFPSSEIAFFIESESGNEFLPDEGNPAVYPFDLNSVFESSTFQLAKNPSIDYRVLSYNVLRDALFDPALKDVYQRLISAIKPDIIGFQEVYQNSGQQAAQLVEEFLPSSEGESWYSGDTGTDNLIVSRYPIVMQETISGNSVYLLDLGDYYIFTIVAHPPCCTNDNGRQNEIDAFMAFLRDSQNGSEFDIPENTPIIIMGDMNLVGLRQQQTTLVTGDIVNENTYGPDFNPDWDGTALDDTKPFNPGLPTSFTWYSPSSSFGAGRLDYIVYSGSVLELENSFSLHTPSLPADSLTAYGLESLDTINASDHIPLVADFTLKTSNSSEQDSGLPKSIRLHQNHPNPFNPSTNISFELNSSSKVRLSIYTLSGREVIKLLDDQPHSAGHHTMSINVSELSSGIYFYQLIAGNETITKKMTLIK